MDAFQPKAKQRRYFTHGCSGCLLFSITICVMFSIWASFIIGANHEHYIISGARGKTPLPEIPLTQEPVVFNINRRWTGSSAEANKLWETEHRNGWNRSFVINNPREYNLGPGNPAGEGGRERFGISMYHQLHCLASIRMAYFNKSHLYQHQHRRDDGPPPDENLRTDLHAEHCFDYLRQAILCSADSTVEWSRVDKDGNLGTIDGWGIPHYQCKDVSVIDDFIAQHK